MRMVDISVARYRRCGVRVFPSISARRGQSQWPRRFQPGAVCETGHVFVKQILDYSVYCHLMKGYLWMIPAFCSMRKIIGKIMTSDISISGPCMRLIGLCFKIIGLKILTSAKTCCVLAYTFMGSTLTPFSSTFSEVFSITIFSIFPDFCIFSRMLCILTGCLR